LRARSHRLHSKGQVAGPRRPLLSRLPLRRTKRPPQEVRRPRPPPLAQTFAEIQARQGRPEQDSQRRTGLARHEPHPVNTAVTCARPPTPPMIRFLSPPLGQPGSPFLTALPLLMAAT